MQNLRPDQAHPPPSKHQSLPEKDRNSRRCRFRRMVSHLTLCSVLTLHELSPHVQTYAITPRGRCTVCYTTTPAPACALPKHLHAYLAVFTLCSNTLTYRSVHLPTRGMPERYTISKSTSCAYEGAQHKRSSRLETSSLCNIGNKW